MKSTKAVLLVALALLALLTIYLLRRNPQPPLMPRDRDHAFINADRCLQCHGPDGEHPQSPRHPIGRECSRCHGRQ